MSFWTLQRHEPAGMDRNGQKLQEGTRKGQRGAKMTQNAPKWTEKGQSGQAIAEMARPLPPTRQQTADTAGKPPKQPQPEDHQTSQKTTKIARNPYRTLPISPGSENHLPSSVLYKPLVRVRAGVTELKYVVLEPVYQIIRPPGWSLRA